MAKKISINLDSKGEMLDMYEIKMDEVYLMFHRHPTHIPNYGAGMYDGTGEGYAKGVNTNSKKVHIIGSDSGISNGIRRHR